MAYRGAMVPSDPHDPADDVPAAAGGPSLLSRRMFLALGIAAAAASRAAPGRAAGAPDGASSAPTSGHLSGAELDSIVSVAIHPGVGIARVGNSRDAFYIGPEVPGALPPHGTRFRDAEGAVARQAARFRVYGYDSEGKVVGELTTGDATTDWRVHLANQKAAWYRFGRALDIPEGTTQGRRNHTVKGAARARLVLDAGPHSTAAGTPVALHATARGVRLLLGELLTDDQGRLIVLPGKGVAKAWTGGPVTTFANNDGWLDDVADGPVTASVTIGDRTLDATPSWVVTTPPNFAPGLATGWRTMFDLCEDAWVTAGLMKRGHAVSFQRHIRPLFVRLAELQWVNAGILRDYGWKSPQDLSDPDLLARLADPSIENRPFRRHWAGRFRDLDSGVREPHKLPPILGDAAGYPIFSTRHWIGPTPLQLHRLEAWAEGRFTPDGITEPPVADSVDDLPLQKRPASLDRAALEACLGEAFDPGCELPWTMGNAMMWDAPYRLKVRRKPEPDFGPTLTRTEALSAHGPLAGNVPGSITRWLALPWMVDTVDCLSGYQPSVDRYLDTFWPARVPNQVLTQADYAIVMDESAQLTRRRAAFKRRKSWLRTMITNDRLATLNRMVTRWPRLGFVVAKPGPSDGKFPETFAVEVARTLGEPGANAVEPTPVLRQPGEPGEASVGRDDPGSRSTAPGS